MWVIYTWFNVESHCRSESPVLDVVNDGSTAFFNVYSSFAANLLRVEGLKPAGIAPNAASTSVTSVLTGWQNRKFWDWSNSIFRLNFQEKQLIRFKLKIIYSYTSNLSAELQFFVLPNRNIYSYIHINYHRYYDGNTNFFKSSIWNDRSWWEFVEKVLIIW